MRASRPSRKLASHDVVESLVDKRQGQKQDYLVGPEQKAEIIQQLAARAITGKSTSSNVLAEVINDKIETSANRDKCQARDYRDKVLVKLRCGSGKQ